MKKGTLLALAAFAVLLVAVVATRDRGNVNVGVPKLELPTVEKSKVVSFEISGAMSATLRKDPSGWVVIDPARPDKAHPTDPGQIDSFLDALKDLKATDFVTDKAERLAELEIDSAKGLAIKAQAESGPLFDLVFGKASKTGGVYLRSAKSNQVFATPSHLPWMARREPSHWRKRAFFPGAFADLTQVRVTLEDGSSLPLEVGADGKWALSSGTPTPAGFRFDPDQAKQVALTLASLSAADFVDGPADDSLGLRGPHLTVQGKLKDGKTVTVHLGREPKVPEPYPDGGSRPGASGLAAQIEGEPQIYLVPPHQVEALSKQVTDLRETTLLSFEPDKVTRVAIQTAGKRTVVAKEGGHWKVIEPRALPAGFELAPAQVSAQLDTLKTLRATRAVEAVTEAQAGLVKPSATVELFLEGGAKQVLKFGSEAPGKGPKQVYVKGSIDGLTYAIASSQRERLDGGLELFKKTAPPPGGMGNGQIQGLEDLPPEVRRQLEAQMRQR